MATIRVLKDYNTGSICCNPIYEPVFIFTCLWFSFVRFILASLPFTMDVSNLVEPPFGGVSLCWGATSLYSVCQNNPNLDKSVVCYPLQTNLMSRTRFGTYSNTNQYIIVAPGRCGRTSSRLLQTKSREHICHVPWNAADINTPSLLSQHWLRQH